MNDIRARFDEIIKDVRDKCPLYLSKDMRLKAKIENFNSQLSVVVDFYEDVAVNPKHRLRMYLPLEEVEEAKRLISNNLNYYKQTCDKVH